MQLSDLIEMRLLLVDKIEEIMSLIWKEERVGLDEEFVLNCKRNIFDDMV